MPAHSLFPRRYPRRRAESSWPDLYQHFSDACSFRQCQKIACHHLGIEITESIINRTITSDFPNHHDILRIYGADTLLQALLSDQPLTRPLFLDRQKCLMGWRFEQKLFQSLKEMPHAQNQLSLSAQIITITEQFHNALKKGKPHIAYACFHQALSGKNITIHTEQAYILRQFAPYFTPTLFNYFSNIQTDTIDPAIARPDCAT